MDLRPLVAAPLAALALVAPDPALSQVQAQAQAPDSHLHPVPIAPFVAEASLRFGIPEHWIYAVIRIESAGRIDAVSRAGAMGLMQLMPATWARQRARFGLGGDPFGPRDNILAGTSYLREMYDLYGAPGFLAAYNAGPGRYEAWRAGRRRLPLETRRYIARIAPLLQHERASVAAFLQPESAALAPPTRGPGMPSSPGETAAPVASAHPFERPRQPAHDLFVPVSGLDKP